MEQLGMEQLGMEQLGMEQLGIELQHSYGNKDLPLRRSRFSVDFCSLDDDSLT